MTRLYYRRRFFRQREKFSEPSPNLPIRTVRQKANRKTDRNTDSTTNHRTNRHPYPGFQPVKKPGVLGPFLFPIGNPSAPIIPEIIVRYWQTGPETQNNKMSIQSNRF